MSDEKNTTSQVAEGLAVHAISAAMVTVFFRWQGSKNSFWQAGDESLIANGVGAVFDVIYWLFRPRILKWRGRE